MHDVRYALRRLLASPGSSAVAILSLTLAIGANSAVYSFIHGTLLRPPPFKDPDRLVMVWERDLTSTTPSPQGGSAPPGLMQVSVPNLMDLRAQNRVFEALAGLGPYKPTLEGDPEPIRVRASGVSAELFKMLGVKPMLGRDFLHEEDNPDHDKVAILGYGLWQERYGKDPRILGKTLRLDGKQYVIIGVMPPGFDYPDQTALWKPLGMVAKDWQRNFSLLRSIARLKPGVSVEVAQQNLNSITHRFEELYPDTSKGRGTWVVKLQDSLVGKFRLALLVLWAAVGLVLLIACANISNLLLSRSVERRGEVALRLALGAERGHLIRQLLIESLVLSLISGACGLVLAYWGVHALTPLLEGNLPQLAKVSLDGGVVGFTLLICLLTAVLFGLIPALRGSRAELTDAMRSGGRRTTRASHALQQATVVAQVAVALALFIGAGLLIRSLHGLLDVDPGFRKPEEVLTVDVQMMPQAAYENPVKTVAFMKDLEARYAALPGVRSVGSTWFLPLTSYDGTTSFTVVGRPPAKAGVPPEEVSVQAVTPGYFATMGIPVLRGRAFTVRDDAKAPGVVLVNDALARHFFPGQNPLGQRLTFDIDFGPAGQLATGTREIVGVVGDVRHSGLDVDAPPELYFANYQATWRWASVVLRADHPASLSAAVRRQVRELDPNLALGKVRTLNEIMQDTVVQRRLSTWLLTAFAVIALILAGVGVYGVISYSVNQRTAEIGIRMALGAQGGDVLWMVLKTILLLVLTGVVVGLAAALALTRFLNSLLFGVSRLDVATFVAVSAGLIAVTLVAGYLPARRATRVDPVEAIR